MRTEHPNQQIYSDYTAQDFAVWKILFDRQMALLRPVASQAYLDALETVQFTNDRIPDFKQVNALLQPLTGWALTVVPNLCPDKAFFEHLAQQQFTATCWLRSIEQLDYLEEPDMFHDVFAHVPLLSNKEYVGFFKGLSRLALRFINDAEMIDILSRIYWFTIEFGMIREHGALKIYGAGILSSKGETIHCLSDAAIKEPFDVAKILATGYRKDVRQEKYFVIESFEQLYRSLPVIEQALNAHYRLCRA